MCRERIALLDIGRIPKQGSHGRAGCANTIKIEVGGERRMAASGGRTSARDARRERGALLLQHR